MFDDPEDDPEFQEFAEGIVYRPCKFCFSYDYDSVLDYDEKLLEEEGIFQPISGCSCCGFGTLVGAKITFH